MSKRLAGRIRRLEIEAQAGMDWLAIEVPYDGKAGRPMDGDTALAELGLKPEPGQALILITNYAAEAPRLIGPWRGAPH